MAFWNKGEDPWDVKPKPVSVPNPDCDGEPDTVLDFRPGVDGVSQSDKDCEDELRTYAEQANKREEEH